MISKYQSDLNAGLEKWYLDDPRLQRYLSMTDDELRAISKVRGDAPRYALLIGAYNIEHDCVDADDIGE